jgi:pseudouridine kinase
LPAADSCGSIACIGGAHLDRRGIVRAPLVLGTSNPGDVQTDFGGVARNVAENLARLGAAVTLISRVGNDSGGRHVVDHASALGIDTSSFTFSETRPTASYTAILENSGELVIGLADMDIYEEITPDLLAPCLPHLRAHSRWFVDANLPGATIDWLLAQAGQIPVAVDAISVAKSRRLIPLVPRIALLFSNLVQAAVMAGQPSFANAEEAGHALAQCGAPAGIVTAGPSGIAVWTEGEVATFRALPATPRDVTGAGDALVAGTLFGLLRGDRLRDAAQLGLAAAAITVESPHSAAPQLTAAHLQERHARA